MHQRTEPGAATASEVVSRLRQERNFPTNATAQLEPQSAELGVASRVSRFRCSRPSMNLELLEQRIEQLQRLELVHMMSAGIAHDFKNIMQVIESYAELLQCSSTPGDPNHAIALEIMAAAARGTMLTNRWLAYSRHGELQKQKVDFAAFVSQCIDKITRDLPKSIEVKVAFCPQTIWCELDPCLVEQALFNLCLNARDAMPRAGVLSVRVERVMINRSTRSDLNLPSGAYGKVIIEDNGTGIPTDLMEQIFEPFFTTKDAAAGTGLGLALVRSIAAEHQGVVEVQSQVGLGSLFAICLPCR